MLGVLHFTDATMRTDEKGNVELCLKVSKDSKYNVKAFLDNVRRNGKDFTGVFNLRKSKRSLDQNALMWRLLTIYADALNGGRVGGIAPEEIYMQMLSKYGIAEFLMVLPEAENTLKEAFRVVRKVDTRDYNGVEMNVYKCYCGSSKYDTKEMTNLIEGIFDELSQLGIDANSSYEVSEYYKEWRGSYDRREVIPT